MTALRWLEWPSPNRSGGSVMLAHAFVTRGRQLDELALCGAGFPQARVVGMAPLDGPHQRCWQCDEQLRTRHGPHPPTERQVLTSDPTCYLPRYTFEDWATS